MRKIHLNRKLTKYAGFPNDNVMLSDNKAKYGAANRLWICMICNKTKNKYTRKRIINHVNSTHGGNKSHKPSRIGKGKLVEYKDNDVSLNMEHVMGELGKNWNSQMK